MEARRVAVVERSRVQLESFSPPAPGAQEVLLRTRTTLISPGTERAFYLGLPNTTQRYPFYPGYSNIADVLECGAEVELLEPGARVASTAPHASHVIMPARGCLPVPDGLADEEASFFNLTAIAMQGVRKARIELGEAVVVLGAGLIGLFALQLAKLSGALPVIAVDRDVDRRALAQNAGADAALTGDEGAPAEIQRETGGDGAAVVIEATGSPAAIPLAFRYAGTRGRVILLGSTRGEVERVDFYRDVHRKGLTIIGAHELTRPHCESSPGRWTQRDEHRVALKLLAQGRLAVAPLISHRFSWPEFPRAYDLLAGQDQSFLGMVIDWGRESG